MHLLALTPPTHAFRSFAAATALAGLAVQAAHGQQLQRTGEAIYADACTACHGLDGRGRPRAEVGFDTPLPDFTDCSFASREASAEWFAIVHEGGPVRAFNRIMPSFGALVSEDEIEAAVGYVKTFCADGRWPQGDFNFPLALFTEKAFPEDEALVVTTLDAEGPAEGEASLIYEKRFGARGQLEINAPLAWADGPDGMETGLGDIAVAWKQNVIASLRRGAIVSLGAETKLPTGDSSRGLGGGTGAVEAFALYGQVLPGDAFLQTQVTFEHPWRDGFEDEAGVRAALGRSFAAGDGFGRAWTPMIEVMGIKPLEDGANVEWDVIPQMQVTLSKRQHIAAALGARLPVTETDGRDSQIVFYILWDWYDGGLREGWR